MGIKSYSQSVSNVSSSQQGNNAVITYDLNGITGDSYFVKLYYSTDGGQTFSNELSQVSGSIKGGVIPGIGKKIIWAADKEVNSLSGQIVFKVEAISKKLSAKLDNISVEVVSIKKNGDELTVEFTVNPNKESDISSLKLEKDSQLTTQDGTQYYPIRGELGTQKMDEYVKSPKGMPTKGVLIYKCETQDLVIASLKLKFYISNPYLGFKSFLVNNIPIE